MKFLIFSLLFSSISFAKDLELKSLKVLQVTCVDDDKTVTFGPMSNAKNEMVDYILTQRGKVIGGGQLKNFNFLYDPELDNDQVDVSLQSSEDSRTYAEISVESKTGLLERVKSAQGNIVVIDQVLIQAEFGKLQIHGGDACTMSIKNPKL